ncbi:DUF1810 domain-containing protein [Sagittula sp. S175]|uniref:DUF1810 domain-containing protein n=1 Tax=Sagittula sp. S175 TaxID=3415129 RepID=UPI003C7CF084
MADLGDFVSAQAPYWPQVQAELRAGRKLTHWIWWFFPQLEVLGRSQRAREFGLAGLDEAAAFLAHPVLGPRLVTCCGMLLEHGDASPEEMLGPVDALKVRSCATLFAAVPDADPVFGEVLNRLYSGTKCPVTRETLGL